MRQGHKPSYSSLQISNILFYVWVMTLPVFVVVANIARLMEIWKVEVEYMNRNQSSWLIYSIPGPKCTGCQHPPPPNRMLCTYIKAIFPSHFRRFYSSRTDLLSCTTPKYLSATWVSSQLESNVLDCQIIHTGWHCEIFLYRNDVCDRPTTNLLQLYSNRSVTE